MSDINGNFAIRVLQPAASASGLGRLIPEPKNRVNFNFGALLKAAGEVASQAGTLVGIDPEYKALLEQQMEMQQQMMLVSMQSNVMRTEHETQMSVVRNLRVA